MKNTGWEGKKFLGRMVSEKYKQRGVTVTGSLEENVRR